jgi:hypothetical protein
MKNNVSIALELRILINFFGSIASSSGTRLPWHAMAPAEKKKIARGGGKRPEEGRKKTQGRESERKTQTQETHGNAWKRIKTH